MRWVALGVDYEMSGKDLINSVGLSSQICRILGREAAGRLQLRAVPRRERREDLQVEGQRPHHRGVARLREPREPVALHVSEPAQGQAALFRRDPARGRRISRPSRRLSEGRAGGEADESGLAHPSTAIRRRPSCRSPSRCCSISRQRLERGGSRRAVGFHPPLRARRDAGGASAARSARRLRDPLLPRFREAGEALPRADRQGARGARWISRRGSPSCARRARRGDPDEVYEVGKGHGFEPLRDWFKALYEVLLGQNRARASAPSSRSTASTKPAR